MAFPWLPAAMVVGSLVSSAASMKSAGDQMDFQRDMSNTSYQRAMADMRKAGLNPMLAYQRGGASTPGGAGFQVENPAESAVTTAMALRRQKADIKNISQDTEKKAAETASSNEDVSIKKKSDEMMQYDLEIKRIQLEALRQAKHAVEQMGSTAKGVPRRLKSWADEWQENLLQHPRNEAMRERKRRLEKKRQQQ